MLTCLMPKLIRELIEQFGGAPSGVFYYISSLLFVSQGFWNALAYGLSSNAIKVCRKKCSKKPKQSALMASMQSKYKALDPSSSLVSGGNGIL